MTSAVAGAREDHAHPHPHPHSHEHPHDHPVEDNSHAGTGFVVLDIGGDIGALIVHCPEAMVGVEIEIAPAPVDRGVHHPHVAVVPRRAGDVADPTAVYAELREGPYDLWVKGDSPVLLTVTVRGGEVTEARWPG